MVKDNAASTRRHRDRITEYQRTIRALHTISPDIDRDLWVKVLTAAKAGDVAKDDAKAWSARGDTYEEKAFESVWRSIDTKGGITVATLFSIAIGSGFEASTPKKAATAPKTISAQKEINGGPKKAHSPEAVIGRSVPVTEGHPYCRKKGLLQSRTGKALDGLLSLPDDDAMTICGKSMAGALVIPLRDYLGNLVSATCIPKDCEGKYNLPGAEMKGGFFSFGALNPGLTGHIYVCEGVGTAWASYTETAHPAVVTCGVGRTEAVIREVLKACPDVIPVIVPDIGQESQAEKVARALSCGYITLPADKPKNYDALDYLTDYDDNFPSLSYVLSDIKRPLPLQQDAVFPPLESNDDDDGIHAHELLCVTPITAMPRTPDWILPGVVASGLTLFAGSHGVGKTTAMIPLAAVAAGFCMPDDVLSPGEKWRHVIYITEDIDQAGRILHGLSQQLGISVERLQERMHFVRAVRMPMQKIVAVGPEYRKRFGRTVGAVEIPPLVVLDTQAATVALDNENDNAEASNAVAMLKQRFSDIPVWLICHVAKSNLGRSDVAALSARGAGAWEADSHATAYLVEEAGIRWLVLGKRRFEARYNELQIVSHTAETDAIDAWGAAERVTLRWGQAVPAEASRKALAAQSREEEEQRTKRDADSALRQAIMDAVQIAQQQGRPLNRTAAAAAVGGKKSAALDCVTRLLQDCRLLEVHIPKDARTNNSRQAYLINLLTPHAEALRRGDMSEAEIAALPEYAIGAPKGP